jgi:hypothetical protein
MPKRSIAVGAGDAREKRDPDDSNRGHGPFLQLQGLETTRADPDETIGVAG